MALGKTGRTLAIMLLPIIWALVGAQPSCPGALTSLTPCLSFSVRNTSTPSSNCCSELANMFQTVPVCLCNVLNGVGGEMLGGFLNQTLSRALPRACNMQIPPISQCDGLGFQGMGGSQDTSDDGAYSEGTILKLPSLLTLFFSLIASYAFRF